HNSLLSRLLYEGGIAGSWKGKYHLLCMDQCGNHYHKLYCHPVTIKLMIEVKGLHKSFGDEHILKGIDFVFDTGKTNLVIGQSGSGKSVFMKCMLGLFTPEKGTIEY